MDPRIHEHSLTFKEEKNDGPPEFCSGCLEPVLGPHYTCNTCNESWRFESYSLIIHKPCAELPREIHHPIHPNHPLILTAIDWPYHISISCRVCGQLYPEGFFLAYYCSGCKFWIDINCAFKWQNDRHEHNFTILRSPIKFTCDVCGQGDDDLPYNPYVCKICQLIVHRECSWLPLQVKIARHQHHLKLTWWFQDMYPKDQDFCDICSLKMDGNRAMYCCHDHECRGYTAHCKCIREEGKYMNILVNDDDDEPSTSRCPPSNETTYWKKTWAENMEKDKQKTWAENMAENMEKDKQKTWAENMAENMEKDKQKTWAENMEKDKQKTWKSKGTHAFFQYSPSSWIKRD